VIDHIRGHAAERPRHPALIVGSDDGSDGVVTYAELVESFEAIAARLCDAGATPAERCGLIARQGRGFVEAALGILAADLCLVPIPDGDSAEAEARHADEA